MTKDKLKTAILKGGIAEIHINSETFSDIEVQIQDYYFHITGTYYEVVSYGAGGSYGFEVERVGSIDDCNLEITELSVTDNEGQEVELTEADKLELISLLQNKLTIILES